MRAASNFESIDRWTPCGLNPGDCRVLQEQFMVKPYLNQQPQVTPRMRAVLVDWLVEVQENFELNHETLYLAVKLVDTYMAIVPNVPRDNIQLIGSVALFLASKFDVRHCFMSVLFCLFVSSKVFMRSKVIYVVIHYHSYIVLHQVFSSILIPPSPHLPH